MHPIWDGVKEMWGELMCVTFHRASWRFYGHNRHTGRCQDYCSKCGRIWDQEEDF